MNYIKGFDQLKDKNNPVRFIDFFVKSLYLVNFGFNDIRKNKNGRPPYPRLLIKTIYEYINKIHSSRTLSKEILNLFDL